MLALALGVLTSCAQFGGGRETRAPLSYLLDSPSRAGVVWEEVVLEDAELAFRGSQHETMAFFSSCKIEARSARTLARQLTTGISPTRWQRRESVTVAGREGWLQEFEFEISDRKRTMKTVTVVANRCSYDWVLVAGSTYDIAVESFDGWWSSFRFAETPTEEKP